MPCRAIQLHARDNIAVCTTPVEVGQTVVVTRPDGTTDEVVALSAITFCNKIALCAVAQGEEILKYGEVIGRSAAPIARGALANDVNIASQPRAYADEYLIRN